MPSSAGYPVVEVLVFSGERNVDAPWLNEKKRVSVRESEFRLECEVLGTEAVCWELDAYRSPGYMPSSKDIDKIVEWFLAKRPGAVIVPPNSDAHLAHRMTRALAAVGLIGASLSDTLVLTGWTPWGALPRPNAYFAYDAEAERTKQWAIHCHASQLMITDYFEFCSHLGRAYAALAREWTEGHHLGRGPNKGGDHIIGIELFQIESHVPDSSPCGPTDPIQIALGVLAGKPDRRREPLAREHGLIPCPLHRAPLHACRHGPHLRRGDGESAPRAAADRIRAAVDAAGAGRARPCLGWPRARRRSPVYAQLVARHRDGDLTFNGVTTYNLDEFYPISPRDPNSYRTFMHRHLFSQVEIAPNQTHVLDGTVPESAVAEHAAQFDRWIAADGGLDLQLLGIGRNGHIGFNEPSDLSVEEALRLPTRLVPLHPITTADTAKDFGGDPDRVPKRALTLGVAAILSAREILILAFGASKADAVAKSIRGPDHRRACPASLLQTVAAKVTWIVDEAAAEGL